MLIAIPILAGRLVEGGTERKSEARGLRLPLRRAAFLYREVSTCGGVDSPMSAWVAALLSCVTHRLGALLAHAVEKIDRPNPRRGGVAHEDSRCTRYRNCYRGASMCARSVGRGS